MVLRGRSDEGAFRRNVLHTEDNDYGGSYSRIFTAIITKSLDSGVSERASRVLVIFRIRSVKELRRLPGKTEDLFIAVLLIANLL